MDTNRIRWHLFNRDQIPDAVFALTSPGGDGLSYIDLQTLSPGKVAVGYREEPREFGRNPSPAIILLGRGVEAADVLSWLNVYVPEAFPLSQFGRVLSIDDWLLLREGDMPLKFEMPSVSKWACITLGELLAQGDGNAELDAIPTSRASACFSMTMARAQRFHSHERVTALCAERLRKLEADRRFVHRPLSVDNLVPMWAITGAPVDRASDATEAAQLVVHAAASESVGYRAPGYAGATLLNSYLSSFASDSVEERVMAFHRLAQSLDNVDRNASSSTAVVLAAGAFLVGRGTSHVFLLKKFSKAAPTAFAWFSLMAALTGPRTWHPAWSRMVKAIERQLRLPFGWADVSTADLSWTEFSWMTSAFEGIGAFVELPKFFPRVLSIEVLPGAVCQLRLATEAGTDTEIVELQDHRKEQELRATLEQFVSLAMRARPLLQDKSSAPRVQESLPLGEDPIVKKTPKARRAKRDW